MTLEICRVRQIACFSCYDERSHGMTKETLPPKCCVALCRIFSHFGLMHRQFEKYCVRLCMNIQTIDQRNVLVIFALKHNGI